ncbi:TonB-linked SusC/RagA family outer membrane protein [Salinibacter ruber]|uniref:SusC/RagA family TonB-linked outer membrane protein n=1 Tax=Salinibacter ruber TaxID=146919 RepID=UPI0013C32AC4|nr:TonB-dependent receptor [Salinibacter ruber]MCS4034537.1 TonB-linked SusC/RagA family outer membrane protein [Salinibacter ruber]
MLRSHSIVLSLALLLLWTAPAVAQEEHAVSGTVTDAANGSTLPGVNIVVKGTTIGTTTDGSGQYELQVPSPSDTLVFSFVGFQRKEVPINDQSTIDVTMRSDVLTQEELVVTGYQQQERSTLTGAVSSVEVEGIEEDPSTNPIKSLQGRIAGVNVQTNGSPFGDASLQIRGASTLGNNSPLYVIDGVPTKNNVEQILSPGSIKSIQVLKDAAAASIYGSRASNGVIVIETKEGGTGNTLEFNYSSDVTLSGWPEGRTYDPLNTRERATAIFRAAINDGRDPNEVAPLYSYDFERQSDGTAVLNGITIADDIGNNTPSAVPGTDWTEKISQAGVVQSHKLSARVGSDRGSAYFGLRFHDNEGIIKQNEFQRVNAQVNSNFNFFDDRLRVGENLTLSKEKGVPLPSGAGGNPFLLSLRLRPIIPVRTGNGEFAGPTGAGSFSDRDNPVRLIEDNRWDEINTGEVFGNINGAFDLTDNLTLQGRFGLNWERTQERDIQQRYQTGFLGRSTNSVSNTDTDDFIWTFNGTVEYDVLLGQSHDVNLLVGTETQDVHVVSNSSLREKFSVQTLDFFVEGAGSGRQLVDGFRTDSRLLSYFSKADYSYQDRYLASVTVRYDGSSRFGENNRFGLFPAFSLGWRVTEENFMEDRFDFLSELKLRGSWGRVGNQEIDNFASLQLFETGFSSDDVLFNAPTSTAYDLGGNDTGTIPGGFRRIQRANQNLQWEETTEIGIGADYGLFGDRLVGSFDYFTRETTDILIQPGFIATVGEGGSQFINGATVETSGFELQLEYRDEIGEFSYSVSGNLGHSSDEITELPADVVDSFPGNSEKNILGRSQFSHFGYVTDGLFRSQDEVDAHADQPGAAVGRLRFKDLNGDGSITPLDQKYLGDSNPDFEYGLSTSLSYKNLDLSVFFQGVQGREVNVGEFKAFTDFTSFFRGENYGSRVLDAYSPKTGENLNSDIPAPTLSDTNGELRTSSYLIEDGSYLKLREVTLGYNLPELVTNTLRLDQARVYARGSNLLIIETGSDEFTGPDPETTNFTFPRPRKLTFGVQVGF